MKEINELRFYIRLQGVLGVANSRTERILEAFGGAQNVFESGPEKRKLSGLFTEKELLAADKITPEYDAKIMASCKKNGILAIHCFDERFPERLRNIPAPPLVLYIKGQLPNIDREPLFCIVGPRKVSEYGRKSAFSLSRRLALSGMTVVSGGAVGADRYAHKGALSVSGKTIAVLPCGLNIDYPVENRLMREEILKNGCLISEYPPDVSVRRHHFKARNRLLSGLSLGVAVVEASERSGALITAHHANEQGRDLFVIPGNPSLPQYKGSNALLRDSARPLLDTFDIFNEYIMLYPDKIDIKKAFEIRSGNGEKQKIQKNFNKVLSKEAKIVYNYLNKQKFTADDVMGAGLSEDELLAALTELEMEGCIKALPGGYYILL